MFFDDILVKQREISFVKRKESLFLIPLYFLLAVTIAKAISDDNGIPMCYLSVDIVNRIAICPKTLLYNNCAVKTVERA